MRYAHATLHTQPYARMPSIRASTSQCPNVKPLFCTSMTLAGMWMLMKEGWGVANMEGEGQSRGVNEG